MLAPGDGSWSLSGVLDLGQEFFGGTGTSGHPHVYPHPCWPWVECSALMMTEHVPGSDQGSTCIRRWGGRGC